MTLHDDTRSPRTRGAARGLLSAAGAAAAGLAASACCWLPLVALATGASFGGAAAVFERYRPLLGGVALAALAAGFFALYVAPRLRRREAASEGGACDETCAACDRPGVLAQVLFWTSAAVVAASLSFPRWAPALLERASSQQATAAEAPAAQQAAAGVSSGGKALAPVSGKTVRTATLRIEGMTCAACAAGIQAQLRTIPGVRDARVDYEQGAASLLVASPQALEQAIHTITAMGYTARPVDGGDAPDGAR